MQGNISVLKHSDPANVTNIDVCQQLHDFDFVFLESNNFLDVIHQSHFSSQDIADFQASWDDLKPDTYMADGGKYRLRRHATLTGAPKGGPVTLEKHQPHFQTTSYNPLNGGIERHFEPVLASTIENPVMQAIFSFASSTFGALSPFSTWHMELHQFRIEAVQTGGKPTPEGVHRDGVDFVLMVLINRQNIVGGETSILDRDGVKLAEFTLTDPFDAAIVNDERVAHGVTPITKLDPDQQGLRDVLVLTFRRK
ncbi:2OG-Fe dioxygenase family protein [Agrobacterium vitis]|uniref:2OG-Fe dioxygenase family protein n=1 Tax=Agrobacterium vitis TaxID=373 RepID=UPI0012E944CE|nr:2OG-Fe dioxygenase family protein [Agrobacterium vitis]MVA53246.1 hypothetical protein [Agrobacterium vitis]NSZ52041.1 2OG-Fe dioxygenase family protein [Agrobacterium vitis]NTA30800.1 2OG-Fe dioxygenase family protein [Agrobacterium vitis]